MRDSESSVMTDKTKKYLVKVAKEVGCFLPLTKKYGKEAEELVEAKCAIFIPVSTGGAQVALTDHGIDEAYKLTNGDE